MLEEPDLTDSDFLAELIAPAHADLDHHQAQSVGGKTVRHNLGPATRRWHRLKTFDGWTVKQTPNSWQWTSPTGRSNRGMGAL